MRVKLVNKAGRRKKGLVNIPSDANRRATVSCWQSSRTDKVGQVKADLVTNRPPPSLIAVEDFAASFPTEARAVIVRNNKSHSSLSEAWIADIYDEN